MKYFLSLCLLSFSLPLLAQATVTQGVATDPLASPEYRLKSPSRAVTGIPPVSARSIS